MTEKLTIKEIMGQIQENWPRAMGPETPVILGVIRLNDIIAEGTNRIVGEYGLTQSSFEVLMTLRAQPLPRQLTPTGLYQALLISSGGMTKVLKQLEQDGLVRRIAHETDQRSRYVQLTEAGERMAEQAFDAVTAFESAVLTKALSRDQITHLGETLLQALDPLERERGA